MDKEKIKKYIEDNGFNCPFCGAIESVESLGSFGGGKIGYHKVWCTRCEKSWRDVWKLVGIE